MRSERPKYRPSYVEIGKRLGWKAKQVDAALQPLLNNVVDYERATRSWRVIF